MLKTSYLLAVIWLAFSLNCFGIFQNNNNRNLKARADQWAAQQKSIGFQENKGQVAGDDGMPVPSVLYKAKASGLDLYITESGLTYVFLKKVKKKKIREEEEENEKDPEKRLAEEMEKRTIDEKVKYARVDMLLKSASIKKENITEEFPEDHTKDYYLGHCPEGIRGVKSFERITVKNIYEGIDWVLYGGENATVKYDFIVHPGADPAVIKMVYKWADVFLKENGNNLVVKTPLGKMTEGAVKSFVDDAPVQTNYMIKNNEVSFALGNYDKTQTLVIDPPLVWSTYYGGESDDNFRSCTTDSNLNFYITGFTTSVAFPTKIQAGGYFQGTFSGNYDVVILKFAPSGALLWSTYHGGNSSDIAVCINVDAADNIFVVGDSYSTNFPTQNPGGGAYYQPGFGGFMDGIILKFNSTGTRLWATYFGGTSGEYPSSSVVDPSGDFIFTGLSPQGGMPVLNPGGGAYFQGFAGGGDVMVVKFTNAGVLKWSTYYGGGSLDDEGPIAVDGLGNIYITVDMEPASGFPTFNPGGGAFFQGVGGGGQGDAYILKFSNTGARLWATYIGGNGWDLGNYACTADCMGNFFVAIKTPSTDMPLKNGGGYFQAASGGGNDLYVAKFDPACVMQWATYFGGSGEDAPGDMTTDCVGNIYITGNTGSANFPTKNPGGFFKGSLSDTYDAFVVEFTGAGVLAWSTYYGGNNFDNTYTLGAITIDASGYIYICGDTRSTDINLVNPGSAYMQNFVGSGGPSDAFIAKFGPLPPIVINVQQNTTICNGASTVLTATGANTYTWSPSAGLSSTTGSSVTASPAVTTTYTVTGKTICGCQDTAKVTVTVNPCGCVNPPVISVSKNDAVCGSTNGSAVVTVNSGGTAPFTYSWSPIGGTATTASGLPSGTYDITTIDGAGCKAIKTVTITDYKPWAVVATQTDVSCSGGSDGSAVIQAGGGFGAYTYSWSPSGGTGATATGRPAGNYTVTVKDANGCSVVVNATINQPAPLSYSLTPTSTTCGLNNGQIYATATGAGGSYGGTYPYTYAWSPTGGVSTSATNLAPGTYTFVITDSKGCTKSATASIGASTNPNVATFTQSPTGTVCINTPVNFTNTGTPPGTGITYSWIISTITPANVSGTTTDFSYTFLTVGTYTVSHRVTSGGCTANINSTVNVINCSGGPTVTATGSSVCPAGCANVTSSGAGGTSPYTYSWSSGETTQNINPCPATTTTYTVTIKDTGGNTSTSTAVVTVNPAVTVSTSPTGITCNGGTNGSAMASPGGGTAPYIYVWSNGQTSQTVTNLTSGNYTVTVVDTKGCTSTSITTITTPPPLSGQFTKGTAGCPGCSCKQWVLVNASGGTSPYSYSWPDGYVNRYKNQLCPGNYVVNVKDKNGCSVNINLTAP